MADTPDASGENADNSPTEPLSYAVRFSTQAEQDLGDITEALADRSGEPAKAFQWAKDFATGVGKQLAGFPHSYEAAGPPLSTLFPSVTLRKMRYPRKGAWQQTVYYTVEDETPDGPMVRIVHIRGVTRGPLTTEEARQILANQ